MINQVTLVGRLTRDPQLNYTSDGIPVANVTLAVERNFRNREGDIETDFVQCTLWKKTAENTAQYCKQGTIVGINGWIQTRNYENSEGRRVFVTEVIADTVKFIGGNYRPAANQNKKSNREETQIG